MNGFEIKKVENCFAKSAVYQYRFKFIITEEFISGFGSSGEVKIKKNFPRPSYTINLPDGTMIVGALKDVAFKVIYPKENSDILKQSFEKLLSGILGNYHNEGD